jgi:hypothetical protein
MQAKQIPPDFTSEASYRAYLKACAAGLVRINGKIEDSAKAEAQLTALSGATNYPPDFTSEASYQAYLKAEAAGQVRIFTGNPGRAAQPTPQPVPAALSAAPTPSQSDTCHMNQKGEWVNCRGFVGVAVLTARPAH